MPITVTPKTSLQRTRTEVMISLSKRRMRT
jgi:hypothetical protein